MDFPGFRCRPGDRQIAVTVGQVPDAGLETAGSLSRQPLGCRFFDNWFGKLHISKPWVSRYCLEPGRSLAMSLQNMNLDAH
jgi:hypothetical protein